jgi:flagellar protein FliJ
MPKFKFRLDSVINLKEEQKKQVAIELANTRKERKIIENSLKMAVSRKESVFRGLKTKKNDQVLSFQTDYYYIQALEKTINTCFKKIQRIKRVEENIIKDIIRLDQQKKTIEKLKEKKKIQFDEESKQEETKFLDEVSKRLKYQL